MDRYQALPDLPFPVVIEALGYPLSEFQTEKVWNRVGGQMPPPQTEEEQHGIQLQRRWQVRLSCAANGRGSLDLVMQARACGFQEAVQHPRAVCRRRDHTSGAGPGEEARNQASPGATDREPAFKSSYEKFLKPVSVENSIRAIAGACSFRL
jgi:hypothetical protein